MKKIIYKEIEYYYKFTEAFYDYTDIFSTSEQETKGFLWWKRKVPKFLFRVYVDFDNVDNSEKYLKQQFKKALNKYKKEIEISKREKIEL